MGLADRLRRAKKLEGALGPQLCESRTCMLVVTTEAILHPDGTKERLGEGPPPLCGTCPYLEGGGPIRHIEVVKRY